MAYSALDVAKYIVNYANNNHEGITHLQLQKILYYAQATFLVDHDKELFEEPIRAWKHGPVIRDVYTRYASWASLSISEIRKPNEKISKNDCSVLERVVDIFICNTGWKLVEMTHKDLPWLEVYNGGKGKNNEITQQRISDYYKLPENKGKLNGIYG